MPIPILMPETEIHPVAINTPVVATPEAAVASTQVDTTPYLLTNDDPALNHTAVNAGPTAQPVSQFSSDGVQMSPESNDLEGQPSYTLSSEPEETPPPPPKRPFSWRIPALIIILILLIGGFLTTALLTGRKKAPSKTDNNSGSASVQLIHTDQTLTINNNLKVSGLTELQDLIVHGHATFENGLSLTGNLAVNGNGTFTGDITARNFIGDGSRLTNLPIPTVPTNIVLLNPPSAQDGNINITGVVAAGGLQGNGANITGINAANIASGILSDNRLSSNVALLNQNAAFSGNVSAVSFTQNGNTVCDSSNNCGSGANSFVQGGNSFGAVAVLGTNDNFALNLRTNGTTRLTIDTSGNLGLNTSASVIANRLAQTASGNNISIDSGNDNIIFTAGGRNFSFPTSGPASQQICTTGIVCASGGGQAVLLAPGSAQTDNTSDASIFINDTGGGNLLQLQNGGSDVFVVDNGGNVTATAFSGNGANLTSLNASNLSSGTLSDSRLSSNVPLKNAANTFTALNNFTGGLQRNGNDVCDTSGNCAAAGAAGGDLTGTYPNPTIAKLQGTNLTITSPVGGHVLIYNGTNGRWENHAVSSDVTISETGVATIQANAVALGTDTTGNYAANLGALTGLSTTGNSGEGSTPTLSVLYGTTANTAVQGNVTLICPSGTGNLSGGGNTITLGSGGTCNSVTIINNPTFTTSVTTPQLIFTGAGSNGTLQIASLGQSTTYTLPDPGVATASICLTTGNCAGSGSGVTTPGGTAGAIAKFTGSQVIANSTLSESGSTLTASGTLVVQGASSLTLGTASTNTGAILLKNATNANTLTLQSGVSASNFSLTLPTGPGNNGDCLQTNGAGGVLSFTACTGGAGGGVTSIDS
ncbi:MAG TPA: hypothetical protein VLE74_02340, partial [Candidatus Saccharimonadales bacterium]|nr:hypothetical protein [Candidatus Saccharimonadales bacterium]